MVQLEGKYKTELKKRMEARFPGAIILKNDEQLLPGIFDLIILWGPWYAAVEVKRNATARYRPNQEYYLNRVVEMGGLAFTLYPENEEEVLDEIQQSFEACG
jgi:4-amino-4-deoxy-L-arabinose transferase-like glycosyltransferase